MRPRTRRFPLPLRCLRKLVRRRSFLSRLLPTLPQRQVEAPHAEPKTPPRWRSPSLNPGETTTRTCTPGASWHRRNSRVAVTQRRVRVRHAPRRRLIPHRQRGLGRLRRASAGPLAVPPVGPQPAGQRAGAEPALSRARRSPGPAAHALPLLPEAAQRHRELPNRGRQRRHGAELLRLPAGERAHLQREALREHRLHQVPQVILPRVQLLQSRQVLEPRRPPHPQVLRALPGRQSAGRDKSTLGSPVAHQREHLLS